MAPDYCQMLGDAGAIETLSCVLQIHIPTADDFLMNVSLVTRKNHKLDGNVRRKIFEFLYWAEEHTTLAELCCRVIGRLFRHDIPSEDNSNVLHGISLALAAHHKNANAALEALTTISTCQLIKTSTTVSSKFLYDSIAKTLKIHISAAHIVTMCSRVIKDLVTNNFNASNLGLCDAIIACLMEFQNEKNILNGVFGKLCDTANLMSGNDVSIRERFADLNIRQVVGMQDRDMFFLHTSYRYI